MYRIKKVMVGLDFTSHDQILMEYTAYLTRTLQVEEVWFVHAEYKFDIERDPDSPVYGLGISYEEPVKELLEKTVKKGFDNSAGVRVKTRVLKGGTVKEMLRLIRDEDMDMLVVGKKDDEDGTGVVPEKLARKAHCAVLIVPQHPSHKLEKILIPVDFSEYSLLAFEKARNVLEHKPEAELFVLHVSQMPTGYYASGKSYEEFAEIMLGHAKRKYEKFITKNGLSDLKLNPVFRIRDDQHYSKSILEEARKLEADIILIGAKGQSAISVLLLGSVTESLIRRNTTFPIMILKRKDEYMGLIDALMEV